MTYLLQAYPGINPKYNGLYGASEDPNMTNMNNVLRSVAVQGGVDETTRLNTTWYANVKIIKGLTAEAKFNFQDNTWDQEHWSKDLPSYRFREGTETPVENIGNLEQATTYRSSQRGMGYTADLLLNYIRTFGNHDVSALFGYEQAYSASKSFNATKRGLLDWSLTDFTSGVNMDAMGGNAKSDNAIISYFGRVNYAFKGKYFFEANFRSDASSRFAPGHRWGTFPSFSTGWRISEESFFEPYQNYINHLKLKASWGELGNTAPVGNYDWMSVYGAQSVVMNEAVAKGLVVTKLSNYGLSWEKTATTNIGFEASFLKQRLSVEFEYYNRYTTDILNAPPVYITLGNVSAPTVNTACMINRGADIIVNWNDRIGDFRYSVSANASYNTNRVTDFKGALNYDADPNTPDRWGNPTYSYLNLADVSTGGDTRRVEGYMLDEYFLRTPYHGTGTYYQDGKVDPNGGPKDGMIRTKADLEWVKVMIAQGYSFNTKTVDKTGAANLWYGEMIMADTNGDGMYGDDKDRQFIGKSSRPKWTFGTTITGEWKGLDLNMTWSGRLGSWSYINSRGANSSVVSENTDALSADVLNKYYSYDAVKAATDYDNYDPATDPNANIHGEYPRLVSASNSIPSNTFYLYNTSFLKLRTLQIGYTLPKKWTSAAKIGKLRLFASGENLLTIHSSRFPGVDPELGSSLIVYPIAKLLSGGITVTF
jgi:TonB-linked SusC/RagA family outer membrane protein